MRAVIRHLRMAALCGKGDGPSDGQLLEFFVVRRDETAFEALVRRHGSMVLGVCQRILGNVHDAEDAFQATFLILARKAATVKPRELVGNWLYGVAYRTALKARTMNAKRRTKEKQVSEIPRAGSSVDEELLARLDHELNRLPDKYRVPVVLCELEGRTRKEVARILGLPEGTLSWRLAHAKKLLGRRLSHYGAVAVSALLAESAASACLSPLLRAATTKTALTAGAVSANVLALTEGVMKAMLLSKLKITVCMAALTLVAGVGTTGLTYRAAAQQPQEGTVLASRPQADELEALRLEIEALRKSLHATRERVKMLEEEVRLLPRAERNPLQMRMGAKGGGMMGMLKGDMKESTTLPRSGVQRGGAASGSSRSADLDVDRFGAGGRSGGSTRRVPQGISPGSPMPGGPPTKPRPGAAPVPPSSNTPAPEDSSLSQAEKALKRLRENPKDTKAVEMLERALKRLKEREKP